MNELISALKSRFGDENVNTLKFTKTENEGLKNYEFIEVKIFKRSPIKVLLTNGLSDYEMPVSEKFISKKFNELYFCLPSYWDLEDQNEGNYSWVFESLYKYHQHLITKDTWFGHGHTIPFSNPLGAISEKMKQSYFFISNPVFLKEDLEPIKLQDKMIHFLGLIPIFEDELDYKLGQGTYKFEKKLASQSVTELLDDYRATVLKSKWRFFGK